MVAPLVGAWIEMFCVRRISTNLPVAPLVGAWIEIRLTVALATSNSVAPLVGAWIEITPYHKSWYPL